jgi:hypothetical protein
MTMLKRTRTALLALIVLALLAGDHFTRIGNTPADRIFSKYKEKHTSVRAEIRTVGEELREILKTRERTPAPRIYIALLAELSRLNAEVKLIESWENGSLSRTDSTALMADSLLVLEYLHMTACYAKAINESMRRTPQAGRALASSDVLEQAAKDFPRYFDMKKGGAPVFDDAEVLSQSREAGRLAPIAKALFDTSNPQATVGYRVRFFARYSDNIIEKNRARLQEFQKSLVKNGSLAPR